FSSLPSLLQDIRYVALSTEAYNPKDAPIVKNAKIFVEAVVRIANDPSIKDFTTLYNSCYDLAEADLIEYKRRPRPEVNTDLLETLLMDLNAGGTQKEGVPSLPGWARDSIEVLE
ncbi:hypothetical protein PENTCL1PPCAC_12943, partial [Pristionchus entomophagus]